MEKRDSSKTRVAPVFNILCASDKTGKSWLPKLLCLPIGGTSVRPNPSWDFTIEDKGGEPNEKKLEPPVSLLSWLIRHPRMPSDGQLSENASKAQKRKELIEGSDTRLQLMGQVLQSHIS